MGGPEGLRGTNVDRDEAGREGNGPPARATTEPVAPSPPEQTTDDTDVGWGESAGAEPTDERERWLLDERPPHW